MAAAMRITVSIAFGVVTRLGMFALIGMLFVSGARPGHLAVAVLVGVASLPTAYLLGDALPLLKPYQRNRLRSYLVRDETTRRTEGYQLQESLIAIGSGGPTGKGFA